MPEDDDLDDDDDAQGRRKPSEDLVPRKEVNRIAGREKRDGNRQGRRDLIEDILGEGGSEAELRRLVELSQSGKKETSKELEDARRERDEAREEAKRIKEGASHRDLTDRIYDELVEAGLKPKAARRAVKLVDLDDPKANDDEVVGAVDDLRQEMPQLFAATQGTEGEGGEGNDGEGGGSQANGSGTPPPKSDVGKPPAKKKPGEPTSAEKARSRLVKDLPEVFNPDGSRRDQVGSGMTPLKYERT